MHKKLQEMWDSAHEIPKGAYIPKDTLLVQLDLEDDEISYYMENYSNYWKGAPKDAPVRSVEPLPDPNDTGTLGFQLLSDDKIDIRTRSRGVFTTFTRTQARNFAHQLLEALDD